MHCSRGPVKDAGRREICALWLCVKPGLKDGEVSVAVRGMMRSDPKGSKHVSLTFLVRKVFGPVTSFCEAAKEYMLGL